MKKLWLWLGMSFISVILHADIQESAQLAADDLAAVVERVLAEVQSVSTKDENGQRYTVVYIDVEQLLRTFEWGPEFLEDYKRELQFYMMLGMATAKTLNVSEERRAELLEESYQRLLILQRFLRNKLEPYIKEWACDNEADVVVDSYTGSLLYAADHLELEGVTIYS